MSKAELRDLYLDKRQALSPEEHAAQSSKIADLFFSHADLSAINTINCFVSLKHKGEVETALIIERLWTEFPRIATNAPRINLSSGEIEAFPFSKDTTLIENRWRIPEPAAGEPVDPAKIDLVIVPLLCFDERGYRVGYGRGFYDKFLARCRPDCFKVGLSFFSAIDRVMDLDQYDVALGACVTPEKVYVFTPR
jgi:5-formyltetrahydrofolate cyclo-ligase